MISILLVDDEIHAVHGIEQNIAWRKLGIDAGQVHAAYSMKQAQQVLRQHKIDIMLCDIEMPKGTGLELLEWTRREGYDPVHLILTSHADFSYANQALRLGSLDYILKPVPYDELTAAISRAVQRVLEKRRQREAAVHAEYWQQSSIQLMEQFWRDVALGIIPPRQKNIAESAERLHIHFDGSHICPVLAELFPHDNVDEKWEPNLFEYGLKNILAEILFDEEQLPIISRINENIYLVVIQVDRDGGTVAQDQVASKCQLVIEPINNVLESSINFYINNAVPPSELQEHVQLLMDSMRNNILLHNTVIRAKKNLTERFFNDMPQMDKWIEKVFTGRYGEVLEEISHYLRYTASRDINRQYLQQFYHAFLQGIYSILAKREIYAHTLFHDNASQIKSAKSTESISGMIDWIKHVTETIQSVTNRSDEQMGAVALAKKYIREHLAEEITRDEIATNVYLSPDYLSHIFKDQTGSSLSEYIIRERMDKAKDLLICTDLPIQEIALQVGYGNLSYFAKLFKRTTDMKPNDFRKSAMNNS